MACDRDDAALTAVAPVALLSPAEASRECSSAAVETSTSAAPDEASGLPLPWLLLLLPSESRSVIVGAESAAADEAENGAEATPAAAPAGWTSGR